MRLRYTKRDNCNTSIARTCFYYRCLRVRVQDSNSNLLIQGIHENARLYTMCNKVLFHGATGRIPNQQTVCTIYHLSNESLTCLQRGIAILLLLSLKTPRANSEWTWHKTINHMRSSAQCICRCPFTYAFKYDLI
jgi:hypothetical protein